MGSKRWMLGNSLGDTLHEQIEQADRFIDLFAGSGAVSWFVAERHDVPVVAVDLQHYSKTLIESVLLRTAAHDVKPLKQEWLAKTKASWETLDQKRLAAAFDREGGPLVKDVHASRRLCATTKGGVIWRNYGGHYFSPTQALAIDSLRSALPDDRIQRTLALGALLTAATRCAASPGHLAQPLQPSAGTKPYLRLYWNRDLFEATGKALDELAAKFAKRAGRAVVSEATKYVNNLRQGDLVFLDPPYSSVQYSRFYHVLETITTGSMSAAQGRGRYPPESERPASKFSMPAQSKDAMELLLRRLARKQCRVIVTFPEYEASNGLSGTWIAKKAKEWFRAHSHPVGIKHSTLGGKQVEAETDADGRPPTMARTELILTLTPRK